MVLVAIESVASPNHYVRLDGQGVTSFTGSGGGTVNTQTFIGTYETYTLVVNDDKTVSFKSTVFDNVFLRLEATGVAAGQLLGPGGGTVNAQFTARSLERFKIHKKDDPAGKYQGVVGIESAANPGRFLRVDVSANKVNVQGVFKSLEEVKILVVGQ
ncbi:uncharacterized protein LACBIDRAFT_291363 [Laccaria bicolor S238N-H82]|uniref:Predicted protein n=1 Tax=Laccaria bicolor (strain S238N-H82 / ATCC MYA-4686) TaxID=486041 RepID=B0DV26_LACBS|nr:uncharacterized protein LACBIDRAFT_291363 [Laccaria bicolor S238N-H82]EDR01504.1 predicted protein [Laccaria bicolor S238N-H82]|eukprot:XP_001887856.1 predicted protein [Laccaria bicolor S238N-H82]